MWRDQCQFTGDDTFETSRRLNRLTHLTDWTPPPLFRSFRSHYTISRFNSWIVEFSAEFSGPNIFRELYLRNLADLFLMRSRSQSSEKSFLTRYTPGTIFCVDVSIPRWTSRGEFWTRFVKVTYACPRRAPHDLNQILTFARSCRVASWKFYIRRSPPLFLPFLHDAVVIPKAWDPAGRIWEIGRIDSSRLNERQVR